MCEDMPPSGGEGALPCGLLASGGEGALPCGLLTSGGEGALPCGLLAKSEWAGTRQKEKSKN